MRIIHVLRKPLSEGTVASNVLKPQYADTGGASRFYKQVGGGKVSE